MITIDKFKELKDIIIIDIRESYEYDLIHIKGSILIPKDILLIEIKNVIKDKKQKFYLICRTGSRTGFMSQVLKMKGYDCIDVIGGLEAYFNKKIKG